ncbi:MAG TPA: GNAT family N-acetyltransferase [Clostridia bacterium]|nr:GNAT family N-acetyltransferase [Clostridia bacterium]
MNYEILEATKKSQDLYKLYSELGWNKFLRLSEKELNQAMQNSWYVIYIYDHETLIGTGRMLSDGIINAYILGVGVHPGYQNKGLGEEIIQLLVKKGKEARLNMQLFCKEDVKSYYEKQKFSCFAAGMVYRG